MSMDLPLLPPGPVILGVPQNEDAEREWALYLKAGEQERCVLLALALMGGAASKTRLTTVVNKLTAFTLGIGKLTDVELANALKNLHRNGMVSTREQIIHGMPVLCERVCRDWLRTPAHHAFLPILSTALGDGRSWQQREDEVLRNLRMALYSGNVAVTEVVFSVAANTLRVDSLQNWVPVRLLCTPWDENWLRSLPANNLCYCLGRLVRLVPYAMQSLPCSPGLLQIVQEQPLADSMEVMEGLSRVLLLQGEFAQAEQLMQPYAQTVLMRTVLFRAMAELMQGRVSEALALYEECIALVRKETRKRKVSLGHPACYLYQLALLGSNTPASRRLWLEQARLDHKEQSSHASLDLLNLAQLLQDNQPYLTYGRLEPHGLSRLIQLLTHYWADEPCFRPDVVKAAQALAEQAEAIGMAWLAAQARDLVARCDNRGPDPELARRGWFALADLYTITPSWQRVLTALTALGCPASPSTVTIAPEKPARLAWQLRADKSQYMAIEPREQKRAANGKWSSGRAVALSRLRTDHMSMEGISDADRKVIACIVEERQNYNYHPRLVLPFEQALPALIGHPCVFWNDAPEVRVEVASGEVSLRLRERKEQLLLALEPEVPHPEADSFWRKETPTRLLVYRITPAVRQVANLLGPELSVPVSARKMTLEAIGALAPLLPIQSDVAGLAADIESVPADPMLYAHLLPAGEGLRVQLLVRPLTEGSWHHPGKGGETVIGERDSKPVQTRRNLKAEKQALKQALDFCTSLSEGEELQGEWHLEAPAACLEFLLQLRELAEVVTPLWPQGQSYKVGRETTEQALKLGIKQEQDWFGISGELQLDDGRVIALKNLLDLLGQQPGRFIKLGEHEYLALTERLRKRLDELKALADTQGKHGLRVPKLAAHLLQDLADSAGSASLDAAFKQQAQRIRKAAEFRAELPGTLQAELRDYQRDGFQWLARLAEWGVGACLADDMGLGKTIQTLALLLYRAKDGPALVLAPTSVCHNWQTEAQRFAPSLRIRMYHGERRLDDLGPLDVVVASYGLVQNDSDAFTAITWHTLVLDEAQAIKNAQTKRSQAVLKLQADYRIACTGTPLENHLGELWNLFRFLNPGLLGSQERFNQRYALAIENGDPGARQRLKRLLQPFLLRRLKSEVLTELPPRIEVVYPVVLPPEEMELYQAARLRALEAVQAAPHDAKDARFVMLTQITRLRRLCCHPSLVYPEVQLAGAKMMAFAEIVATLLENRHKALVFSQFVDVLSLARAVLEQRGVPYQYLDGATPMAERKKRVDAFQAGAGEVFLISLKAGGTGLNLTAADYVIHLDPWWNPAVEDQASDRAHRMGQERPVTIYRLVAQHTIEERIVALHAQKRELADSLLDEGEASARIGAEALLALLREEQG